VAPIWIILLLAALSLGAALVVRKRSRSATRPSAESVGGDAPTYLSPLLDNPPTTRFVSPARVKRSVGFAPSNSSNALLDVIEIPTPRKPARIELHSGDLTRLQKEDAVDVLVVSSFPDDYYPRHDSLIGALYRKGISVAALAQHKHVDLREAFSCWLSDEIASSDAGIEFKRILCFESGYRSLGVPAAIGDIFRALAPFVAGGFSLSSIAMPMLATGSQRHSAEDILPPLLNAAIQWLRAGLPISKIAIYAHNESHAQEAAQIFADTKSRWVSEELLTASPPIYDAFISYARADSSAALAVAKSLQARNLRVFVDQLEIDQGVAWQQHMFEALDRTKKVIAIYSPDYIKSKVCQEEFNIAWARGRKLSKNLILPIYWRSGNLPTYMELLNYIDCREQVSGRLEAACKTLMSAEGVCD
jgi:hypothetical protein